MKMPVFRVATSAAPADRIRDLGNRIFPREDHEIVERGARVELRSRLGKVEVDLGRGGVWASDRNRLWRFDPASSRKRDLVTGAEAERRGLSLLREHAVLPNIAAPFRLRPARVSGAMTAVAGTNGAKRQVIQEDSTILADVEIDVSEFGLNQKTLPLVGGGGRFSAVLGEGGRPLAVRGVWRQPVGKPTLHEMVPQAKADEAFRALTAKTPVKEFSSELAYYAAPSFTAQDHLYPVYVYSGIAEYNGKRVPLRKILIPATDVGPRPRTNGIQVPRSKNGGPPVRPLPHDFELTPGKPLPPGVGVNRRVMREKGLKYSDLFAESVPGAPLVLKTDFDFSILKELGNLFGFYSAGTSWIGLSGGLAGSENNAQGFVDELEDIGWNIKFNWGDENAWESDWRRNDDDWVDSVDFVFYTGHANSDGWVLSAPDDDWLDASETSGSKDIWGAKNLEWAVVAACGPLQDDLVGSGGDVLDRWRNAFDGLHILMGYAQVTYDNEEEGKRLAQYAKAGDTIIQSWFRTGQEIQPGGIWVGAYYVGNSTGSTGNDHLWGVGSIGPDISSPTWRACSWVPC